MSLFRYTIRAMFITHEHTLTPPLWEELHQSCEVIMPPQMSNQAADLLESIGFLVPDVVVIDLAAAVLPTCMLIRQIRALTPHTHVLVVAERDAVVDIRRTLQAGALGYVYRDEVTAKLGAAIQATMQERVILDVAMASEIHAYFAATASVALTRLEERILSFLAAGWAYADIMQQEGLTATVVHSHLGNIVLKMSLGLRDWPDATLAAARWEHDDILAYAHDQASHEYVNDLEAIVSMIVIPFFMPFLGTSHLFAEKVTQLQKTALWQFLKKLQPMLVVLL